VAIGEATELRPARRRTSAAAVVQVVSRESETKRLEVEVAQKSARGGRVLPALPTPRIRRCASPSPDRFSLGNWGLGDRDFVMGGAFEQTRSVESERAMPLVGLVC
jgi:hypothetical protein